MKVNNLKEFHKVVCESEGYICRVCKMDFSYDHYFNEDGVNTNVCGHHYPHTQKARPDLAFETDNGVCLCFNCHTKAHKGLVKIPEKVYKTAEIVSKPKTNVYKPEVFDHYLPSGRGINLRPGEKICKCKKYVAQKLAGICMACERKGAPSFLKESPKPKKK